MTNKTLNQRDENSDSWPRGLFAECLLVEFMVSFTGLSWLSVCYDLYPDQPVARFEYRGEISMNINDLSNGLIDIPHCLRIAPLARGRGTRPAAGNL